MGNSSQRFSWLILAAVVLLVGHTEVLSQEAFNSDNVHPPGIQPEREASRSGSGVQTPSEGFIEPPGTNNGDVGPVGPHGPDEETAENSGLGTEREPAIPLGTGELGAGNPGVDTGLGPLGPGGENFNPGTVLEPGTGAQGSGSVPQGSGSVPQGSGSGPGPQGPAVSELDHHGEEHGPSGTDEHLNEHGDTLPAQPLHPEHTGQTEREVVPVEGGVIPGTQLGGQDLLNPHPQAGVEHPHPHETVIGHPVDSGVRPGPGEIPTDHPQIDGEELSRRILKPTPPSVLVPNLPTDSGSENTSVMTTGDLTNSSHTGEEILPGEVTPEHVSQASLDVHTTLLTSSAFFEQILSSASISTESSLLLSNDTDVMIPDPDFNLLLTSRPIVVDTGTVTETERSEYVDNEVTNDLQSSEQMVVEMSTSIISSSVSTCTNQPLSSSTHETSTEGFIDLPVSETASSSLCHESGETLSTKDIHKEEKPLKTVTMVVPEQSQSPSSDIIPSRSVATEQTLSVHIISPTASYSLTPTASSVTERPTSQAPSTEPIVTLPVASQGIIVRKQTSPQPAVPTQRTQPSTASTGSTSLLTSLFRNLSLSTTAAQTRAPSTGAPTGGVTLTPPTTTPHTTTPPTTTLRTVLTTSQKGRKKPLTPHMNTTQQPITTQSSFSSSSPLSSSSSSSSSSSTSSRPSSASSSSTSTRIPRTWIPPVSTKPAVFAQVKLNMSWCDFGVYKDTFVEELKEIFHVEGRHNVSTRQIMLMDTRYSECLDLMGMGLEKDIIINFYMVDVLGNYDEDLTVDCARVVISGFNRKVESVFASKLIEVKLNTDRRQITTTYRVPIERLPEEKSLFHEPGIVIVVIISSVGGTCCVILIILQIVIRKRNKRLYLAETRHHHSFTSMDSIAMASVTKSRPNSGLFNPGLDQAEMTEPLFPVNFAGLANRCLEPDVIKEEFQYVPNYTPKLSTVPVGAEDKNRYANVIPVPQTRVKLRRRVSQINSDYINANFITGYGDDKQAYIATQAPLDCTVSDFWRMVWEQQSRVIIMLTAIQENGHPKCAQYWPDCFGDSLQRYGDFMIHLKKKDVHQEYIITILELKDIENNLVREIKHCWYTCWPVNGTPEPISLVKFILDTRVFYEDSGAPLIVHCSPGTGRTGTFIATDICMRQYETRRIVDILNTVYRMRQERAGAVQTKEQYILIYNALNEYASVLSSPAISTASSSMTIHNLP